MTASQLARLSPAEREQRALQTLGAWHRRTKDTRFKCVALLKIRELTPSPDPSDRRADGITAAEAAQMLTDAFRAGRPGVAS